LVAGPITFAAYSLFYDKQCLEQVGLYDESQPLTQDADMLIRLARRFPLVGVPEILTQIRRHSAQWSADGRWAREAYKYYRAWLKRLSLAELFPEFEVATSRAARGRARLWLADGYSAYAVAPYIKLAREQYRAALQENLFVLPTVASQLTRSFVRTLNNNRQFYRIGLRTAISRRLRRAQQ
jgi:hypothetical protein